MKLSCCHRHILMQNRGRILRYSLLLLLLGFVGYTRNNHAAGEFYATRIYPHLSDMLSHLARFSSFSLEEMVVCVSVLLLLRCLIGLRKRNWKKQLGLCVEILLWIAAWFYWGWGINYFRYSFYERMDLQPVAYEDSVFQQFLNEYTTALNNSYIPFADSTAAASWETEIRQIYHTAPPEAALCRPQEHFTPKRLAFNTLYSKVGVLGFMGPFFCEMQVNGELLPTQYPFTYAHELAHLLGVSSEAEANYWAYKVCTASKNPHVRFSGYLGILPYVMNQTYGSLAPVQYRNWLQSIRPEVLILAEKENRYWQEKYSVWIGRMQDALYEAFLKGNQISSGQKNYGQVLSLIISEREQKAFCLNNPQIP